MKRLITPCILAGAALLVSACQDQEQDIMAPETVVARGVTGSPNQQFWRQCQNNHSYEDECDWVTGNLNQTHNSWAEGDFVPKVLRINDINNTDDFEVVMTYGFLKGGLTTHDFLGEWNITQTGANPCVNNRFDVPEFCAGGSLNTIDATSNSMAVLSQNAVAAACGPQYQTDMAEAIAAVGAGTLVIKGINVDAIDVHTITFDGCPASGDAEAELTMTVTPNSDATGDDGILLLMAAHVARSFDWDNGGAADVSGSPYHLGLVSVDGNTAGSMDLQMAAAAIVVPGMKSGTKFEDLDGDGVFDAEESGISGWTINAYADDDGNGVLSQAEFDAGAFDSQVTDANGDYSFTLPPGDYLVCEEQQSGWLQSAPSGGGATGDCSIDSSLAPDGFAVTITEGSIEEDNDFGNYMTGTKSGTKFEDDDADGVFDAEESGISGWTIEAYADDGDGVLSAGEYGAGAADSEVTDSNGDYTLTLDPGDYVVCEVAQTGWTQSAPDNTKCQAGSATLADGGFAVTITSGSSESDNDFGNYMTGTKSGTKFEDDDADGVFDAEESGISGWTIEAYADDGDGVLSAGEYGAGAADSDVTDSNGDYTLTLDPGDYVVCEVAQTDWTQSAPDNTKCQAGAATLADGGFAVTITSGSSETDNDFGNYQTGTKSGTKFEDDDADGVFDAEESGISGWTIEAYADDGDGVLSAGEYGAGAADSEVTDSNGDYTLTLDPGDYVVCEVAQTGWTQSAPDNTKCQAGSATLADGGFAVTITSGSSESDNDFGNYQTGTKSGTKFEDDDADGVFDAEESGISGWTIEAYADDGDGVLSAGEYGAGAADSEVTDSNGDYTLTLDPGDYIVCEVAQTGWTQSAPDNTKCQAGSATLADGGFAVTITSGSSEIDNDFGNYQTGTKSGTKFEDDDADGVFDAEESGISGWTIEAYADDGDGVLSAGEYGAGAADSEVTDSNGDYTLTLDPGDYVVCEVAQTDWTQSAPDNTKCQAGSATLADGGFAVTITSGSSEIDNDFGNYQTGTKSGTKFEDDDADGVFDAEESGISGWTIEAYADDGDGVLSAGEYGAGAADSEVTDSNGDYTLTLDPGDYIVCEVAQTDWTQSAPDNTKCQAGSATIADGGFAVTITSGSSESDNDFGNYQQGTKSGTKFEDDDADGVFDAEESGISGWTIEAYADDGDGVLSAGEYGAGAVTSDVTDSNGDYTLNLDPGDYIVCEVAQTGWTQSAPDNTKCQAGSATLADGGFAVTITSGSSESDNDFGNWQQGTKSGTKFDDADTDGVFDAGELGLSGWTINAYADDGDGILSLAEFNAGAADSDVTDSNGDYTLNLDPGEYVVCEVQQLDWMQSAPSAVTATGDCSIDASLGPEGFAVTITSGSSEENNDFGNFLPPDDETAYALGIERLGDSYDVDPEALETTCFIDNGFSNWGWTNRIERNEVYFFPVYAGAGGCEGGELAGVVRIEWTGNNLDVQWTPQPGFTQVEEHVYFGDEPYPTGNDGEPTVAPGQYTVDATGGNQKWLIYHAVVEVPEQ